MMTQFSRNISQQCMLCEDGGLNKILCVYIYVYIHTQRDGNNSI